MQPKRHLAHYWLHLKTSSPFHAWRSPTVPTHEAENAWLLPTVVASLMWILNRVRSRHQSLWIGSTASVAFQ
ncbi:Uncharacterised protein [Vibrio cholerae]|nr:Uncharacterised protein [Vibrio cholerae]